jgi:lysophospholipase L1-like esterase
VSASTPSLEALAGVERLLRGALDVVRTPTGIVPLRLPEHAFAQMPDPFTRDVFRMLAGVRLELVTEATELEVDVAVSQAPFGGPEGPLLPAVFDLIVDGRLHESGPGDGTLRFDGLPRGRKEVELWFPANASAEVRALRADEPFEPLERRRPRWLHYGSSISHCAEARRPTETWPAVTARLAGLEMTNLGAAGNCHLDQFVARAMRDAPADCISIKVGINIAGRDTLKHRTFVPAVHGFLDTVRDGHPDTPVLLASPVICPMLEGSAGPLLRDADGGLSLDASADNDLSLTRMRELLAEIVAARATAGENIHYLDGLRLFGEADLPDLPDGVHPTPDGYIRIGERFADAVFARGCFAAVEAA